MGILDLLPRLFHSQSKVVRALEWVNKSKQNAHASYVYVLGSGYKFTSKAVFVSATDSSRFLLNCGPGTSRVLNEHRGKFRRLSAVLVTRPTWDNIGGLPSVLFKLNDSRSHDCGVLGFPSIDQLIQCGRAFLHYHHSKLISMSGNYSDKNVYVVQVQLNCQQGFDSLRNKCKSTKGFSEDSDIVNAYILKTNPQKARTINVEKILELGVTPGAQLVDLLNGKSVTLPNGNVINPNDVLHSFKVNVVVAIECPSEDYMKSVEDNENFKQSQLDSEECNTTVVHFSPPNVMNSQRYIKWMKEYSPSTIHLIVNESNLTDGLVTLRYRQQLLSKLHPGFFPPLKDTGFYWVNAKHHINRKQDKLKYIQNEPFDEAEKLDCVQEEEEHEETPWGSELWLSKWKGMEDLKICEGRPGTRIPFRPFGVERLSETLFDELTYHEGFKGALPVDILDSMRKKFLDVGVDLSNPSQIQADYENVYPRVIFLGTASKTDSKDRNVTGILLRISKESSMILDCGEATHAQIHRLFGDKAPEIFRSINAVYISHLHGDHHMGLTDMIRDRANSFKDKKPSPLLLFATAHMDRWLNFTKKFIPDEQQIRHIHLHGLLPDAIGDARTAALKAMDYVYSRMGLLKIQTLRVPHCNEAYAVALQHSDGWKITYSGDTMFTKRLAEIGQDSDLLIHEATYDDAHEQLAIRNRHSTVSQAIESGRRMNAKFTILTHVSQRYSIIPSVEMKTVTDFSFAFDLMQIPLKYCHHLPILHELYSYLSDAYLNDDPAEELEEEEEEEEKREEKKREKS